MHKWLLIVCLLIFSLNSRAQSLVANGDFEDENICTEYRVLCAPEAWFHFPGVANYFISRNIAKPYSGTKFEMVKMGNIAARSSMGSYVYTKLLCPLVEGKEYRLTLYIAAPGGNFNHLDVWIGDAEPGSSAMPYHQLEPSFTIEPKYIIERIPPGWVKTQLIFTAGGDEHFLLFGNLSNIPMTRDKFMASNSRGDVVYQIDKMELVALDTTMPICPKYDAIIKQVYDQNNRHPAGLVESIPIDQSLIKVMPPKEVIKVTIIDTPPIIALNDTLVIPDVLFKFNSSTLNPVFIALLDTALMKLKTSSYKSIEITGHTDSIGTDAYNNTLSLNRALAVKKYILQQLQLKDELIQVKGNGKQRPIASNTTKEGRQKNRRVEIVLIK
jgi:outer membrane protein OmpA-like peptidoglycan-associated protein